MAILNDTQREVTQEALDKFIEARVLLDIASFASYYPHPLIRQAQADGFDSMIEELQQQLDEYDRMTDDGGQDNANG